MVLKRGENVGERLIRHSSEQEVLEVIVSGRRETIIRETIMTEG
jgi:simple sugar transport system ATP-binding protein